MPTPYQAAFFAFVARNHAPSTSAQYVSHVSGALAKGAPIGATALEAMEVCTQHFTLATWPQRDQAWRCWVRFLQAEHPDLAPPTQDEDAPEPLADLRIFSAHLIQQRYPVRLVARYVEVLQAYSATCTEPGSAYLDLSPRRQADLDMIYPVHRAWCEATGRAPLPAYRVDLSIVGAYGLVGMLSTRAPARLLVQMTWQDVVARSTSFALREISQPGSTYLPVITAWQVFAWKEFIAPASPLALLFPVEPGSTLAHTIASLRRLEGQAHHLISSSPPESSPQQRIEASLRRVEVVPATAPPTAPPATAAESIPGVRLDTPVAAAPWQVLAKHDLG